MMSIVFLVCMFMSSSFATFSSDSQMANSQFFFEQTQFENFADSSGDAISGNQFDVQTINNLDINDAEFGVGLGQFSNQTEAFSDFGDALSGNSFSADSISNSSIIGEQVSASNFAEAVDGVANAGNIFEVNGGVTDSNIDITQVALYNNAISNGDANSGNILDLGSIFGGSVEHSQSSFGNSATSDWGNANSANVINLDNLSGRKLLKFIN